MRDPREAATRRSSRKRFRQTYVGQLIETWLADAEVLPENKFLDDLVVCHRYGQLRAIRLVNMLQLSGLDM